MQSIGIGDYADLIKLLLEESAKVLILLLFAVLAVRLWRGWPKLEGGNRRTTLGLAALMSLATCAIGYASISHSLSLLYSNYGTRAFRAGNMGSALLLYQKSAGYWKNADALGGEGVCLMLLGHPEQGTHRWRLRRPCEKERARRSKTIMRASFTF